MSFYTVEEVIDWETIKVSPKWTFKGVEGDIVKISGLNDSLSEKQKLEIKESLENFIKKNKYIELRGAFLCNPNHPISCRVFWNSINVSRFYEKIKA